MKVERIQFERIGGFAGMRIAAEFELDDLPDEQSRALIDLLDDIHFDELPEHMTNDPTMSDQFTYTITVEGDKRNHTVVMGDTSDEKMQKLLEILNRIARSQMKKK